MRPESKDKDQNMKNRLFKLLLVQLLCVAAAAQNIGINATGDLPHAKAMLDISSTSSGLLIPRMSAAERNAITSPPDGLQVYNTTTHTLDIYKSNSWQALQYNDPAVVVVRSLADLPAPSGSGILLDSTKTYSFSGLVNISPYYLNVNGAALKGTNPVSDGLLSTVSGAILRSTDKHVYMEKMLVVPYTAATKAFDFSDATGTRSCNLLTGINIKDGPTGSEGVGQVSGFRAVIILQNYWNTAKGIKVNGVMGRFICAFSLISGIASGSGIEFTSGLDIDDIDLSNNHFVYSGQVGVKMDAAASVDKGRMTTNMFRGVGTLLEGFDSYTPGWEMQQNTGIPNSRAFGYSYMNGNTVSTALTSSGVYYKIGGSTTAVNARRFVHGDNRFTYIGTRPIVATIFAAVGGRSSSSNTDISIAIAKNGTIIEYPNASMGAMTNNQGYQISLETEVSLTTGDYLEVFLKRNNEAVTSILISDMQFRVRD